MGLQIGGAGFSFAGTTGYAKGCYAYERGTLNGILYYGRGGTTEQMQKSLLSPRYRPVGYDCSIEGK